MIARVRLSIPLITTAIRIDDFRQAPNRRANPTSLSLTAAMRYGKIRGGEPKAPLYFVFIGLISKKGRFSRRWMCLVFLPIADWPKAPVHGRSSRTGSGQRAGQSRPCRDSRALGVWQQHTGAKLKCPLESIDRLPRLTNQSRIAVDRASGAARVGVRPAPVAGARFRAEAAAGKTATPRNGRRMGTVGEPPGCDRAGKMPALRSAVGLGSVVRIQKMWSDRSWNVVQNQQKIPQSSGSSATHSRSAVSRPFQRPQTGRASATIEQQDLFRHKCTPRVGAVREPPLRAQERCLGARTT